MSLEAALLANTKALETHSALLEQLLKVNGNAPLPIYGRASSDDPRPPANNDTSKATAETTPALKTDVKSETKTDKPAPTLTYKDAQKAILDLAKVKGRDAAVAVIAGIKAGAQKLPEILPVGDDEKDKEKPLPPELAKLARQVIDAVEAKKAA